MWKMQKPEIAKQLPVFEFGARLEHVG